MYVKDTTLLLKVFNQQPVGNLLAYILADDEPHTYPVKLVVFHEYQSYVREQYQQKLQPQKIDDTNQHLLFLLVYKP